MELYEKIINEKNFFLIAGPCAIEEESLMLETASFLKNEAQERDITFIFKSSYKKANRTSINSPTGVGLKTGLKILSKIKKKLDIPIITDVHETKEIKKVTQVADIIQIPAFLCRQTELITAAAQTGTIVNLKKGQFMAPEDMEEACKKVTSQNNFQILLTERGSCFGYHNLVVDFRGFSILADTGYPVVFDVTHSLQRPSIKKTSGGTPEYAEMMAKAGLATGMVKGLFLETHPHPMEAISDSSSMLPLNQIPELLDNCLKIIQ